VVRDLLGKEVREVRGGKEYIRRFVVKPLVKWSIGRD
jgi:hypothetical protein